MTRGFVLKAWVCFLCVSFLLLASGFHTMVADAKEMSRPLGEMLSPGDAMFESRESGMEKCGSLAVSNFSGEVLDERL